MVRCISCSVTRDAMVKLCCRKCKIGSSLFDQPSKLTNYFSKHTIPRHEHFAHSVMSHLLKLYVHTTASLGWQPKNFAPCSMVSQLPNFNSDLKPSQMNWASGAPVMRASSTLQWSARSISLRLHPIIRSDVVVVPMAGWPAVSGTSIGIFSIVKRNDLSLKAQKFRSKSWTSMSMSLYTSRKSQEAVLAMWISPLSLSGVKKSLEEIALLWNQAYVAYAINETLVFQQQHRSAS